MPALRPKIVPLTFDQFMEQRGWICYPIELTKLFGVCKRSSSGKILAVGKKATWERDALAFTACAGWTPELIEMLLQHNDKACMRALMVLWESQTKQERARGETFVSNEVGFSGADAPRMTTYCTLLSSGKELPLTALPWLRQKAPRSKFSRLGKYHAQLIAAILAKSHKESVS